MKHIACAVIIRPSLHCHVRNEAWKLMKNDVCWVTAIALALTWDSYASTSVYVYHDTRLNCL